MPMPCGNGRPAPIGHITMRWHTRMSRRTKLELEGRPCAFPSRYSKPTPERGTRSAATERSAFGPERRIKACVNQCLAAFREIESLACGGDVVTATLTPSCAGWRLLFLGSVNPGRNRGESQQRPRETPDLLSQRCGPPEASGTLTVNERCDHASRAQSSRLDRSETLLCGALREANPSCRSFQPWC